MAAHGLRCFRTLYNDYNIHRDIEDRSRTCQCVFERAFEDDEELQEAAAVAATSVERNKDSSCREKRAGRPAEGRKLGSRFMFDTEGHALSSGVCEAAEKPHT